jgi:hypothetical protein
MAATPDAASIHGNLVVSAGPGDDTVQLLNGTVVGGTKSFALGGGTNTVTP